MADIRKENCSRKSNKPRKFSYCPFCGTKLDKGARFCKNCGEEIVDSQQLYQESGCKDSCDENPFERQTVYEGYIHKCPNCGQILNAFELNCPACGYELRSVKASSAVKEFALKLEAIESGREYEKPLGFFAAAEAQQRVSKTDEQKISLIKSFSVPSSKEDMLEFMILAVSNMNMSAYDSFSSGSLSKGEKEINAAWFAKVQQVYEKAKRSHSADSTLAEIQTLYDKCNEKIKSAKKKGAVKWLLTIGWAPILLIVIIIFVSAFSPKWEAEELDRLDNIVLDVQQALDNGEYSYALRIAESIDYQRNDAEMKRKWDIEREYWVDKVIEEAAANGVILEYTPTPDVNKANDKPSDNNDTSSGFVEGFKDGMQPGLDAAKENIDEFNRILNGEESSDSDAKE